MATWTHLYTIETWQAFLDAGGEVTGFPHRRWPTVQQIHVGDTILCYLMGVSRYIGILEVIGEPFLGYKPIWAERVYPARVPVKVRLELLPEYGVPITALEHELSYLRENPLTWTAHFRSAPIAEKPDDAEIIINALEIASEDPTYREFDKRKLQRRVKVYETQAGVYTIPDEPLSSIDLESDNDETDDTPPRPITHEEIQWLLLHVGSSMGLDVWVARNDRGRAHDDQNFQEIPRLLEDLPRQFDDATQKTVELIDVLWLQRGAILAAFEVEHTSRIYSGLLRMADLLAMQPNLNIRLYIVAPDDRREKVLAEINRPAFVHLGLHHACRYIPYSALKEKVQAIETVLPYLLPEFLTEIAEGVEVDV